MDTEKSNLCRMCLQTSDVKYSLLTKELTHKYESLTDIKIASDDGLPSSCCRSCLLKLRRAYGVQQKARQSDKVLRETMQRDAQPVALEVLRLWESLDQDNTHNEATRLQNTTDNRDANIADISGDHATRNGLPEILGNAEVNTGVVTCHDENLLPEYDNNKLSSGEFDISLLDEYLFDSSDDNNNRNMSLLESNVNNVNTENNIINTSLEYGDENFTTSENLGNDCPQSMSTKNLQCVRCCSTFNSKQCLLRHMRSHNKFECPICHIIVRRDNRQKHMTTHADCNITCNICGKKVKNKESLRGHMNYNHKNALMKCNYCNKEFKTKYEFKVHLESFHLRARNVQRFYDKFSLHSHIERVHE